MVTMHEIARQAASYPPDQHGEVRAEYLTIGLLAKREWHQGVSHYRARGLKITIGREEKIFLGIEVYDIKVEGEARWLRGFAEWLIGMGCE